MLTAHWTKLITISSLQVAISSNLIIAASAAVAEADAATIGTLGATTSASIAAHTWLNLCIAANAAAVSSLAFNKAGLAQALITDNIRAGMKAKVAALGAGSKGVSLVVNAVERGFAYGPG